jgi:homocysteine S-methyltransferase
VSVESPLWSANAVLHHPQAVIDIHSDYIRAGADIITTATFRTDTLTFLSAGFPASQAEETTLRAVELARMAIANSTAERDVWIAGSIAPLADCYQPQAAPDFATALNFHRQRARWLASGGVDFCLLETMNNGMEARAATIAALETGLPVFTSFILNEQGALLSGEEIFPVVNQIVKLGVTGVGINCSHHSLITDFLNKFADRISLPLIVYPNAGVYSTKTGWRSDPEFTPSNYTVIADGWLKKGVKIVGGCCNTTPEYIRAITDLKKSPV